MKKQESPGFSRGEQVNAAATGRRCDWSDLPTATCAHCQGHHEVPEPLGTYQPPAPAGTPVSLGHYQGLPYYRPARSVPQPGHGPACACGRPAGDAYVCPTCLDLLEVHLGDAPALVEDLEVAAQRRDRVTITARRARMPVEPLSVLDGDFWSSDPSSGVLRDSGASDVVTVPAVAADITRRWLAILGRTRPDRKAASDALDTLHSELVSAVRALLEPIGQDYPGNPGTIGLSRWLLAHTRSIAASPAGPGIAEGIARAHHRAMRIIDNAAEPILYGWCRVTIGDGLPCDEPVAIPAGIDTWQCPGCGTAYSAPELQALRIERARDQNLTVRQLAAVAGRSRHAINGLLRRRGIQSVGQVVEDGQAVAIYPAGPVLDAIGAAETA